MILSLVFFWFHTLVNKLVDLLWLLNVVELLLELLVWILMALVVAEVLGLGLVLLKSLHQLLLMNIRFLSCLKLLNAWSLRLLWSLLLVEA